MQIEFVTYTDFIVKFFFVLLLAVTSKTKLNSERSPRRTHTAATVRYHVYDEQSTRRTTVAHRRTAGLILHA